jgi:hypothetical protein
MRTHLKDLDRIILQHCERDFVLLQDLLKHVPQGTLYRHVSTLLTAGFLVKRGRTYFTTEQGNRQLAEWTSRFDWNIWDGIYPPIHSVPTSQHRAVIELATAAVAARQVLSQEDHHPGFVLMGPSLAWKTSATKFQCFLLGLTTSQTIIDLTTESGRSLLGRRDGKGNLAFKRDLLEGPLIVFDDFLEGEASLRPILHHFLSGRTVVPVDNATLQILPVSMLTLNPRPKATLEERTTMSTAQLRRLVVTNLDSVVLPDLANIGHRALEAAAKHGPLRLKAPTVDAQTWRPHIVSLVRQTLMPHVWRRVDTEMIIIMTTGMSAFIPDPERAIQQAVYDYALTAETLGWTTPGWSQAVIQFSLHKPLLRRQPEKQEPAPPQEGQEPIILWRHAMEGFCESALPPFVISDKNRARLLAIAINENIPIERADHALDVILDNWEQRQRDGHTLDEAYSALELSKELGQRSLAIQDVKLAMRLRHHIQAGAYTVNDLQAAIDLAPVLRAQGLTAHDDRLEAIVAVAGRLLNSDRSLVELEEWLQYQPDEGSQENEAPDSSEPEGN